MDKVTRNEAAEGRPARPGTDNGAMMGLPRRSKLEILGATMLGLFLATLDQTVVSTALPRIITDLHGLDYYTWVSTAYLLTSTISIPFYGKLSDLYGRKPLLLGGIGLFLAGSVLAGLSGSMWQLVLFRGIQGLGGGALFPLTLAVIGDMFAPQERARYQGLGGAVFGISALIGPALGGFLTESASWHWVFFVNVPLGLVSLYLIARLMPDIRRTAVHRLDYAGGAVFTAAISLVLVGLTNKRTGDWTDITVGGLIGAGLVLAAVFAWIESRAAEPIVPLGLFRNRTYATAILGTFLLAFAFFTAIAFLPLWFQVVRGSTPTQSGYQILAYLAGVIGSSVVSGILVSRTGRYRVLIVASVIVTLAGLGLMTRLQATTELPVLWAWMFVTGVGLGPTLAVFMLAVQNAVAEADMGVATQQPDLLPPGRRLGRTGGRRDDLLVEPARRHPGPDGRGGCTAADRLGLHERWVRPQPAARGRRRPRGADPVGRAGVGPGPGGAGHPEHGGRHPPGDVALDRGHLRLRGDRHGRRARRRGPPAGVADGPREGGRQARRGGRAGRARVPAGSGRVGQARVATSRWTTRRPAGQRMVVGWAANPPARAAAPRPGAPLSR